MALPAFGLVRDSLRAIRLALGIPSGLHPYSVAECYRLAFGTSNGRLRPVALTGYRETAYAAAGVSTALPAALSAACSASTILRALE